MTKVEKGKLLARLKEVQKEVPEVTNSRAFKALILDMGRDPRARFRTAWKVARIRYLRDVEGRTLAEIGEEMGCTRFTVREILGRGK